LQQKHNKKHSNGYKIKDHTKKIMFGFSKRDYAPSASPKSADVHDNLKYFLIPILVNGTLLKSDQEMNRHESLHAIFFYGRYR